MPRGIRKTHQSPSGNEGAVLAVIENKREKFRRLANQRGKILIKAMKGIGRLGGTGYDRSPEEVEKLIARLTREFNFMTEQLRHGAETDDEEIL